MDTKQLEVIVNVCWRIADRHDVNIFDFIEGLNSKIPDFSFKWDGQNAIIVLTL